MIYDSSNVPTDPAELQRLVIELSQNNAELNSKLDKAITELQRLNRLFEKFFNKSSEKLLKDKDEQKKQDAPPSDEPEAEKPKGKRGEKGGHRRQEMRFLEPLPNNPRFFSAVSCYTYVVDIGIPRIDSAYPQIVSARSSIG